ncbi:MAG: phage major capsid protein [bacterium]
MTEPKEPQEKDLATQLEEKVSELEAKKKEEVERKIKEKEDAVKIAEGMKEFKGLNDKLTKELEALKEQQGNIKESVERDREERKLRFDTTKEVNESAPNSNKGSEFSFARFYNAIAHKNMNLAPYEFKALGESTGSGGGFIVPEEYLGDLRDRITAQSVVRGMGPTVYPMVSDTLLVPKITGGATAVWVGENAQITESQNTFGQLQLIAKLLAALVKVSNQLISDSNPAVETAVRKDTVKVLALAEDIAFLGGSGSANQPTGIINTTGVAEVTLGANGATPTFDNIYDTLYQVELANGVASGWVMHPRTKNTLTKIKDSNGQYIYNVSPSIKEPDTLVGLPVKLTTQVPINLTVGSSSDCSYVICAQWDEAVIGERAGIEFAADTSGTAFEFYQTWIRAIERIDFGLRTPEVFCKMTGVRP